MVEHMPKMQKTLISVLIHTHKNTKRKKEKMAAGPLSLYLRTAVPAEDLSLISHMHMEFHNYT